MEGDSCSLTHDYEGGRKEGWSRELLAAYAPQAVGLERKKKNRKEKQKEVTLFSTTD